MTEADRRYRKRYRKTLKGKLLKRQSRIRQRERLRQTPEGREILRLKRQRKRRQEREGRRRAQHRRYQRIRHTDKYRLTHNAESRRYSQSVVGRLRRFAVCALRRCLNYSKTDKTIRTFQYVGCTPAFLKAYIEQQFSQGMSWNNYGRAWHIDHVFPLASFDLTTEEGKRQACHYTNVRPLWAKANMRKGARLTVRCHQPLLLVSG